MAALCNTSASPFAALAAMPLAATFPSSAAAIAAAPQRAATADAWQQQQQPAAALPALGRFSVGGTGCPTAAAVRAAAAAARLQPRHSSPAPAAAAQLLLAPVGADHGDSYMAAAGLEDAAAFEALLAAASRKPGFYTSSSSACEAPLSPLPPHAAVAAEMSCSTAIQELEELGDEDHGAEQGATSSPHERPALAPPAKFARYSSPASEDDEEEQGGAAVVDDNSDGSGATGHDDAAVDCEDSSSASASPPAALTAVLQQYGARSIADGGPAGIAAAAAGRIAEARLGDTFYLYDLGEVARLHAAWVAALPRVEPFYAVKCNPEPSLVAALAALGAGFDCASIQELQLAAAHGVPQERVIFANPCKRPADFRYAAAQGVALTTFDCVGELHKIAAGCPSLKCVLRIRCDDAGALINLGLKYGADAEDVPSLLATAAELGLQVAGVSFHVGSGCQNVAVYADAIAAARAVFDAAAAAGLPPLTLLDIGGGFTAPADPASARLFYTTAATINGALARHFPAGCGVRVIAEPGRYFAETSATLFTTILGQRCTLLPPAAPTSTALDEAEHDHQEDSQHNNHDNQQQPQAAFFRDYWLSDGTYGSFRIQVAVDGLEPSYSLLRSPLLPPVDEGDPSQAPAPCRLWGNSEREGDVVHKAAMLPPLRDGDWLMFPAAGAYTICAASNYGGVAFATPLKLWVWSAAAQRDTGGFDAAAGAAEAAAWLDAGDDAADPMLVSSGCSALSACGGGSSSTGEEDDGVEEAAAAEQGGGAGGGSMMDADSERSSGSVAPRSPSALLLPDDEHSDATPTEGAAAGDAEVTSMACMA